MAWSLVERSEVAGEQSGRNWGFVRQQGRDPAEVPLMMEANRIWRGLEQELGADIEWVQGGNLALAADPRARSPCSRAGSRRRGRRGSTRACSRPREVQALLPGMAAPGSAGSTRASDGHAEPAKATQALADAAVKHGARLYPGCAARASRPRAAG